MSEIKSQFFNGKTYSAVDFVESNKNTMKDGILPNTDFFKVLPAGNMTIGVTAGRGWVQGHAFSSDSTLSFTLDNADGVLDRIDAVVIRLDLTTDNEKIECKVIKGVLGGSATAAVRDGTYYDLVIAQIVVAHGTTAITMAMITDKRGDGILCGWSGAISADQFNFAEKADKTYCDDTFTTKNAFAACKSIVDAINNDTNLTNADKILSKAVSLPYANIIKYDGTKITTLEKNPILINSSVYGSGVTKTLNFSKQGYDYISLGVSYLFDGVYGPYSYNGLVAIGDTLTLKGTSYLTGMGDTTNTVISTVNITVTSTGLTIISPNVSGAYNGFQATIVAKGAF